MSYPLALMPLQTDALSMPMISQRAIHNTVPLSITQAEQISASREWASTRAVAATAVQDRDENDAASEASTAASESQAPAPRGGRTIEF